MVTAALSAAAAAGSTPRARVRFRRAWIAGAGIWAVLAVFFAVELHVNLPPGRALPFATILAANLVWYLLWGALSLVVFRIAERVPFVPGRRARALAIHAASFLGLALLQITLSELVLHPFRSIAVSLRDLGLLEAMLGHARFNFQRYCLIYWVLVLIANLARERQAAHDKALAAAALREDLARAELSALRLQIQPHFLFNAMNAAAEHVHTDPELADAMLVNLGRLLRTSLESTGRPELPLAQELEHVRLYLEVERLRHGPRLAVDYRVPAELEHALVPSFLLQPLVENAVRHGVETRSQPSRIEVAARRAGGLLELEVSNDVGPPRRAPARRGGIGLSNLLQRLERLHGAAATLELILPGVVAGRARVLVRLPLRFEDPPLGSRPEDS
jgi:sensor histidine kinase YesM